MKGKSINSILLLSLLILLSGGVFANGGKLVHGKIIDQKTGEIIAGATIKTVNGKLGTYSSPSGYFRLPVPEATDRIKIKSLGYISKTVNVQKDTMLIKLEQSPILMKSVEVTGDIEPDEVVRRAIERKEENMAKIKTHTGKLYSKLVLELGGPVFADADSDEESISIGGTIGEKAPEKYKMFLMETFSRTYRDFDKNVSHTEIINRRQTSNIEPQQNILALANFNSFYQDRIKLPGTEIITPLSEDAFSYYNFDFKGKTAMDKRYVYIIDVQPSSPVFPAFSGVMKIIEGTYDLIEIDVRPSKSTAVSFIDSLHFIQKFDEIKENIWYPKFLEVNAKARVDVIKGIINVNADLKAASIYSEVEINKPLPDSIYKKEIPRITVSKKADSLQGEFWEKNSLRSITEREEQIYREVDSLVALDTSETTSNEFDFSYFPYIDFNRVNSIGLGLLMSIDYKSLNLNSAGFFSFGQQEPFGNAELSYTVFSKRKSRLKFNVGIFSGIESIPFDDDYPRLANAGAAAFLHYDAFDYFRKDGFSAGVDASVLGIGLKGKVEFSNHLSLNKKTDISIFHDNLWRRNPQIEEGYYNTYTLGINANTNRTFGWDSRFRADINVNILYGENEAKDFQSIEGDIKFKIPTFYTGYSPLMLDLKFAGGLADRNLPLQYQSRMPSWMWGLNPGDRFYSSPLGYFAGQEFYNGHLSYNLTDIWWRAIGLPLYEGRGLDLILAGSAGKYFMFGESFNYSNTYGLISGTYYNGKPEFYSEVGFALGRIPIFISNVIYLRFDARWGIGPLGSGNFGSTISISGPLSEL